MREDEKKRRSTPCAYVSKGIICQGVRFSSEAWVIDLGYGALTFSADIRQHYTEASCYATLSGILA